MRFHFNSYFVPPYLKEKESHPARGATLPAYQPRRYIRYFNPRTPCGVRLGLVCVREGQYG